MVRGSRRSDVTCALTYVITEEPPAGQLRVASSETTSFTASLLAAVAKMFPSTLFSTGGDEINANCYAQDTETQKELNATGKTFEEALDTFTQATHKALIAEGKTPVVWEGESARSATWGCDSAISRDDSRSQRYARERHSGAVRSPFQICQKHAMLIALQSLDLIR